MFTGTYIVTLVVNKYMTKLVKKATATQSLDRSMHICLESRVGYYHNFHSSSDLCNCDSTSAPVGSVHCQLQGDPATATINFYSYDHTLGSEL